MTEFSKIYDVFFDSITDDMYMEITKEETEKMVFSLFTNALPWFEFPRFNIYAYDLDLDGYEYNMSMEEIKIIATYMIVEWLGQ